jgi:Fic family protein
VDGNGRIHRYLIHHVLLRKEYVSKGIIFPVSAIILERLDEYRRVLEHYSKPRLDLIEWKPADNNNVEVLNETIDLYRYFDATKQAEFLYSCVQQTIEKTIPEEVEYLEKYDLMKNYLDNYFEMPDKTVALLVRFLEQGNGKLSERARTKEFRELTDEEVAAIEREYREIFK